MPLDNLAQHPLMLHRLTQNLYCTIFLKTSALPTRLPCSTNIHFIHVTLMGMFHSRSMWSFLLHHDASAYRKWNLFWITLSTWGRGLLVSSLPFQTLLFAGQLLWRLEGHLTRQVGSQCNSEYEIRICFQTSLTIASKYNPDIIFHTLLKEFSVLQQCLRPGYNLYILPSICRQGMTTPLGGRHSCWWWFPKQHLCINLGINSVG